jgi:hypothetical protein
VNHTSSVQSRQSLVISGVIIEHKLRSCIHKLNNLHEIAQMNYCVHAALWQLHRNNAVSKYV